MVKGINDGFCGSIWRFFTDMADHARKLARANGVADIVEVTQRSMENVVPLEKGGSLFVD